MGKFILTVLILTFNMLVAAQIKTVNVSTQGTLKNLLTSTELKTVTTLTLSGNIDARDFAFMRDKMSLLSVLDLTLVNIKAYSGNDGTNTGVNTAYQANEIPVYAFYNPLLMTYKPGLTSIKFPVSIYKIGEYAFYYCSNLASTITIPAGLIKIGDYAFYGCTSITAFSVVSSNPRYSSGNGVLFNKNQDSLFIFPSAKGNTYSIPSTVKYIGKSAFDNCYKVTSVNIPSSVTGIGSYAFSGCSGITGDLTLPSSVKSLGDGAFYGCYNLTGAVNIPASLVDLGNYCFLECNNVTSINVDASNPAYSSDNGILYSKNSDTLFICPPARTGSVTIPETVKLIGSYAFCNCSKISGTLRIPALTDYTGYYAFYGCTGLSAFTVDESNLYFTAEDGVLMTKAKDRIIACPPFKTSVYQMPETVRTIDPSAFAFCQLQGTLSLPASVTSIGDYAFYNCKYIDNFEVEPSNPRYLSYNGVLLNRNMDSLLICPYAKQGYYAVPEGVKYIGNSAFDGCASINSVSLPASLIKIGDYAFEYCTGLSKILIPSNTTIISYGAFYSCSNLTEFKIANPVPPVVDYYALDLINKSTCQLIVPTGSKTSYQSAPYWSNFMMISESDSFSMNFEADLIKQRVYSRNEDVVAEGLKYGDQIDIYSLNGQKIVSGKVSQQSMFWRLPLNKVYLVKISNNRYKVIH